MAPLRFPSTTNAAQFVATNVFFYQLTDFLVQSLKTLSRQVSYVLCKIQASLARNKKDG